VKYYVPKNCAVSGRNFDSDSRSPADRKLWRQHFASILRIARNIHHRRFFPEQEEEVAGIEQMNELEYKMLLLELLHLSPQKKP
jgi:hypothetical protein